MKIELNLSIRVTQQIQTLPLIRRFRKKIEIDLPEGATVADVKLGPNNEIRVSINADGIVNEASFWKLDLDWQPNGLAYTKQMARPIDPEAWRAAVD
ncbi:MAG: hypothetical protein WDN47_02120 [Candidatus Doudnabacteria bacterium]